jgi:hypothetical protein
MVDELLGVPRRGRVLRLLPLKIHVQYGRDTTAGRGVTMSENTIQTVGAWQAGEQVVRVLRHSQSIVTIDRVTPAGFAVVDAGHYGSDGMRRGEARYRDRIERRTPAALAALRDENRRYDLVMRMQHRVIWKERSLTTLEAIVELLKADGACEHGETP